MAYKLIAVDIDDTLLNNEGKLSKRTIETVARAEKAGLKVVLSTGRAYVGIKRLYEELNLTGPMICCGGAHVYSPEGEMIYSLPLDPKDTRNVIDFAHEAGQYYQVYLHGTFCYEKRTRFSDYYANFYGVDGMEIPQLATMDPILTPKVLFIDDPENILKVQPIASERFPHMKLVRSKAIFLEFNNPDATKGNALRFIAEHYGYDQSEIIAAGDSQIDCSMIEYAGLGVAVGNALDEVKEVADYIADTNDNDGIAKVIEEFMLEEK